MAGKTKDMSQIKQLLLLKKEGVSNRKAAEIVGINKETANNYVRKALADRLGIDGLLKLDDPVLEHRLKGGNPAYTDSRFEVFKELLPYLQEEMRRKHVTLKLLWEEYVEEHPDDHYSLTQFRFHYSQNTEAKKESPSTVLADMRTGGEKLFLDFAGDTMGYIDLETGEMVQCQAFCCNTSRKRLQLPALRPVTAHGGLCVRHHTVPETPWRRAENARSRRPQGSGRQDRQVRAVAQQGA